MKIKNMLPFTLAFVLAGCIPVWSLHPLYDDQHIAFEEKLLGTFTEDKEDTNITWEFTRADEPNTYQLIYSSVSKDEPNGMKGLFEAHLVKLDGHLFLDIFPSNDELKQMKWSINLFFMLHVHTFAKVEIVDSQLNIWLSDDDGLKKLLKQDPNAIKHELVEGGEPVLTASTGQLQEFVLKHVDDSRIFTNGHALVRKTTEPSQDTNQPKKAQPDANSVPADANEIPV